MITTLLAILICIIIIIALLCLYMVFTFLWEFRSFFQNPRINLGKDKDQMDPITPEEQMRRKMNRREE